MKKLLAVLISVALSSFVCAMDLGPLEDGFKAGKAYARAFA